MIARGLSLGVLLLLVASVSARAQGGPPMITDDPDTPGPGYWEINLSTLFLRTHPRAHTFELPRIDANYGVGRRIQLKLEAPWLRSTEDGEVRTGPGNAVAGVKYRFLGEEGRLVAWSVYPQLELNVTHSSVTKGLVDKGPRFVMPTELTLEINHLEINAEVGTTFARGGDDDRFYGISTEGHVVSRFELVAELHGESRRDTRDQILINLGARLKMTEQTILMAALGRGVHGAPEERPRLLLTGLQINLPGQFDFRVRESRATPARSPRKPGAS